MSETYFLSQDNDSHWYVVPRSKQKEWEAWLDIPEDDEASWDVPSFAEEVGGSPELVSFSKFSIE